jgi:adenine-specific DNA methylase
MPGLLTGHERALLTHLEQSGHIARFADIATVDVGIVTGANKFFLVPDAVVQEFGLHRWSHPMFGRSDHVRGMIYDEQHHNENKRLGLPTNFLWFGATAVNEFPKDVLRYIREGEAKGLPQRYKCRIRTPWYNVPSVYAAPIGMLKRSHHFPRLVLNSAKAFTTDTAYRITVKQGKAADMVVSFVNSLTALSCELEGRHYGGGVLELVPSEIEKVLVPVGKHPPRALELLDRSFRAGVSAEDMLARQDELLLKPLGVTSADRAALLAAWARLRDRRQRTTSSVVPVPDD